jgi:RNA-directed DNA polymerase
VLSPLLANIVLNKLDWFLHKSGGYEAKAAKSRWQHGLVNTRFVRYADDWCVFITRGNKQYARNFCDEISEFLSRECGLQLSREKTHITHVRDGFEFLGFHLRAGTGSDGRTVPKIQVPREAVTRIKQRVDEAIRHRPHQESIAVRLKRGSAVLLGCANYYKIAYNFSAVAGEVDNHAHWCSVKTLCRKYNISTGKAHRRYYKRGAIQFSEECRLAKFHEVKPTLYVSGPAAYVPSTACYHEDSDLEVRREHHEKKHPGSQDLKYRALRRDDGKCCRCGKEVSAGQSNADHILPRKAYPEKQSNIGNIQTLCLDCHREKTLMEKS